MGPGSGVRRWRGGSVRRCAAAAFVAGVGLAVAPAMAMADAYGLQTQFGSYGSGPGQFVSAPRGVAVDPSTGDVYAADYGNSRVQKFSAQGAFISSIGSLGSGPGQFNGPTDVAVNPSTGDVYVTDFANTRVEEFTSSGSFVRAFGNAGSGLGQLSEPEKLTIDPGTGDVYVVDSGNRPRVAVFDQSGDYLREILTDVGSAISGSDPTAIAFDPVDQMVFVTDALNKLVDEFTLSGSLTNQFSGTGSGALSAPEGIAFDPIDDDIYVADSANQELIQYTRSGQWISSYGAPGASQFTEPWDITFDGHGTNMYVADWGTSQVDVLGFNGVVVSVSPGEIADDGRATATATAQVYEGGVGQPSDVVVFSSTDPKQKVSATTNEGGGFYSATITASTTPGTSLIEAVDRTELGTGGGAILQQAPARHVSLSLSPPVLESDGGRSYLIATAKVGDNKGPVAGDLVQITSPNAGRVGQTIDNGNGTYSAKVFSNPDQVTGKFTVTAVDLTVAGDLVRGKSRYPTATATASVVLPKLAVSLNPSTIPADGTDTTTAKIKVTAGSYAATGVDQIQVTSSDPGEEIGSVVSAGKGVYTVEITSSLRIGSAKITATDLSTPTPVSASATLYQVKPRTPPPTSNS